MALDLVMIQTGSEIAKMAKSAVSGDQSRVGNLGDFVAPSLDSRPLISPLVPCPGLSLAVTRAAYCSPRG